MILSKDSIKMLSRSNSQMDDENFSSDFDDDDDDPDNLEVPGGGKNLTTVAMRHISKDMLPAHAFDNNGKTMNESCPSWSGQKCLTPHYGVKPNLSFNSGLIVYPPGVHRMTDIAATQDDDFEDEDMDVADTYSNYMPSKMKIGMPHPDSVVETASLSSIEPNDVWYGLSIPKETINSGALSALQLEAITYACQKHEQHLPDGNRAGFLIGDGAGVGKGRTVAGVIFENYLKGRKKAIWVSSSSDLKYDAERDLRDIGASEIKVYALNKLKYEKLSGKGIMFLSYSTLVSESTQINNKFNTRFKQLLKWCHGKSFDGVIVFDECHRAKNLSVANSTKSTKTGSLVLQLQKEMPNARVIYASATGASEPRNMAYMIRLGLWGQGTSFSQFTDFVLSVEKRGISAMEILAMEMKLRGLYIARQLSFNGVRFKVENVKLSRQFIKIYDKCVKLWAHAMREFQKAADLIEAENQMRNTMWCQFWSSHQRFFKYLCIAAKVEYVADMTKNAVKCGKCVVIGLQSTGEARTLDCIEKEGTDLTDFVSTAKGVFQSLVEKHFPAPDRKRINDLLGIHYEGQDKSVLSRSSSVTEIKRKDICVSDFNFNSKRIKAENSDVFKSGKIFRSSEPNSKIFTAACSRISSVTSPVHNSTSVSQDGDPVELACKMKRSLLEKIEILGESLPPNTLDQLIDELGGPENVAEMTGRKGRVVQDKDTIRYESRSEYVSMDSVNLSEKQQFMNSEKHIAIISDAASSGISLQSDKRVKNRRQRVHITLELPWSAEKAIQQFGRTHRSNQVSAPEYIFVISDLAGEQRFASIIAKRLESMGALTHGDRRATEGQDFSKYNFDNKYGQGALEKVMLVISGNSKPIIDPPENYTGDFFTDVAEALVGVGLMYGSNMPGKYMLDKDYMNINKFLNRILGMPAELQNKLFQYFLDTMTAIITQAKKGGNFDLGILDLNSDIDSVKHVKCYSFLNKHSTGSAKTEMHVVYVERGIPWSKILKIFEVSSMEGGGFYKIVKWNTVLFAKLSSEENCFGLRQYSIYKPNIGLQKTKETLKGLEKFTRISEEEACNLWTSHYAASQSLCMHKYVKRFCSNVNCEVGLGHKTYYILAGSVLQIWGQVENIITTGGNRKMQVVRLCTGSGRKIIGTLIPKNCVQTLLHILGENAEKSEEIAY